MHHVSDTTVAVVDDEVAGFVMIAGDEVEQVYVAARYRGTGVADALLTEAERRIRATEHGTAWLAVVGGNARARRFYERLGWTDEGRFDHLAPATKGRSGCQPTGTSSDYDGPGGRSDEVAAELLTFSSS